MKHLLEKRSIKSSSDAIELLNNGKLAGRIGGKKFVPQWVLEDPEHFGALVDATLTLLSDDLNIGSDELIQFLVKCSIRDPSKWEEAIEKAPDALIALSLAFSSQWIKEDYWQGLLNDIIGETWFDSENWKSLEKKLTDELTTRRAKKGRVDKNVLYDVLYDDGTWKLIVPKSQVGDSEAASGMREWTDRGETFNKARWCTAAGMDWYKNYTTPHHSSMYVIQYWENGEYTEAWRLVYDKGHIDFMDKNDRALYATVLNYAPDKLLELIIDDCPSHLHMGINLKDIAEAIKDFDKTSVDVIYMDPEIKYSFFKNNLINKDGYLMTKGGIVIKAPEHATEWNLPEGAVTLNLDITKHAEDAYKNLRKVKFPSTFKFLHADTFRSYENLKEVEFLNVNKIGKGAFAYCYQLDTVKFPKKVEDLVLCSYSFFNCRSLPDISLPSGTTSIGKNSFGNTLVSKLYIPETCTHFNFEGAAGITHIALGKGMTEIPEGSFRNCKALEWVKIPDTMKIIGPEAFSYCESLRRIDLTEGIEEIGVDAFRGSGLEEVKLPESLQILKSGAFKDCRKLFSVTLSHNIKKFKGDAFAFNNSLSKVYNIEILPEAAWLKVFPNYRGI